MKSYPYPYPEDKSRKKEVAGWDYSELLSEHMRKPCLSPHQQPLCFCATTMQKLKHCQQAEHKFCERKEEPECRRNLI